MEQTVESSSSDKPFFETPAHMIQARNALSLLFLFSVLMFSVPFGAFYGTHYFLTQYLYQEGYSITVWSVLSAVVSVNILIVFYAWIAYNEKEFDNEGNEIKNKKDK